MACKEKNSLAVGEFFRRVDTLSINGYEFNYSGACNHCNDPGCMAVCPTGAMHRDEEGFVVHDNAKCIGCGRCVNACPYGAVSLSRGSGYAQKCDACASLRQAGRNPACVDACPTRALRFTDIGNADKEPLLTKGNLCFLPSERETCPATRACNVPLYLQRPIDRPLDVPAAAPENTYQKNTNEHFLVLGGSAAAVTAAEAIRERNHTASVTMISREKYYPYTRPLMSKGAYHGFRNRDYIMIDDLWKKKTEIDVLLHAEIVAIDLEDRHIQLADGRVFSFDKCVYALGADCFIPPIDGAGLKGIFPIRTISDVENLRRSQLAAKKAIIVGGGVIGLEAAWQMRELDLDVVIVELGSTLMGRLCDEKTAQLLKTAFDAHEVEVITGSGLKTIYGRERVESVLLDNGREIAADMVIMSAGIRPNAKIAADSGIAVSRAVIVDSKMRTSCDFVWACGDCAICSGVNNATWIQGVHQGYIAGANAAGDDLYYEEKPSSIVVHAAETMLYTIGDLGKNAAGGSYELVCGTLPPAPDCFLINPSSKALSATHISLCFLDGLLVGAATLGTLKCIRTVQEGVEAHEERNTFMEKMKAFGIRLE